LELFRPKALDHQMGLEVVGGVLRRRRVEAERSYEYCIGSCGVQGAGVQLVVGWVDPDVEHDREASRRACAHACA
jgi:hypothetical protein